MKKEKIYNICVWSIMIDQILKLLITLYMKVNQKIIIIPNFFKLYYVKNPGAAFSIFSGMKYIFIVVAIIIFFSIVNYIKKTDIKEKQEIIPLGLIMGGLVGNLIDRLLVGEVIDYLSFTIFGYNFAIFNFADICIVMGAIVLGIYYIRGDINEKNRSRRTRKSKNR